MQWTVKIADAEVPVLADDANQETVVILAPGAGSHMEHKTMEWLSGLVREVDASVVRFNFLYRVQGRSMPDRMPVLMQTYQAVIDTVRDRLQPKRLIIGGHSMGGRVASMLEADRHTADGLLLFGYPLHPVGQPEKLRRDHLPKITVPVLQLNGTEDPFCTRELMDPIASTLPSEIWRLKWIEAADHSYSVKKSSGRTRGDVESDIREPLSTWLREIP